MVWGILFQLLILLIALALVYEIIRCAVKQGILDAKAELEKTDKKDRQDLQ